MVFPPLPACLLRDTARIDACAGVDLYGDERIETYVLSRVLLQAGRGDRRMGRDVARGTRATDLSASAVLFVDGRRSRPYVDLTEVFYRSHQLGGGMRVIVGDMKYSAVSCEAFGDGRGGVHHWEIGLR